MFAILKNMDSFVADHKNTVQFNEQFVDQTATK